MARIIAIKIYKMLISLILVLYKLKSVLKLLEIYASLDIFWYSVWFRQLQTYQQHSAECIRKSLSLQIEFGKQNVVMIDFA